MISWLWLIPAVIFGIYIGEKLADAKHGSDCFVCQLRLAELLERGDSRDTNVDG